MSTLSSLSVQAEWVTYRVKKGDELGKIIQNLGFKKLLWGENGLVEKIYVKNSPPLDSPNLIKEGQLIYLPNKVGDLESPSDLISFYPDKQEDKVPRESKIKENKISEKEPVENTKRNATLKGGIIASLMDRSLTDKTTNSSGTVQSKAIYGLFLMSRIPFSNLWNIDTSLSFRKIDFASSQTRSFSISTENYLRFSVGASREFTNLTLGSGLIFEQAPIITGVDTTSIGIRSLSILSPYLSGEWRFLKWEKTQLSLGLLTIYNLSGSGDNVDFKSGFDSQVSLDLARQLSKNLSYSIIPFFQYGNKETDTVEHSDTDVGMRLQMSWQH